MGKLFKERKLFKGGNYMRKYGSPIFKITGAVAFTYSEKARKFCEISTLLLSYVVPVKSRVEISQNFVAFSE